MSARPAAGAGRADPGGSGGRRAPRPAVLALGLVVLTLAAFLPALDHGFVAFDDNQYVYDNPRVREGLSWEGALWASGAPVAGHWHPLTLLSHMLDVELYGLDPRGHHLTSVALHAVNAVLLFAFLHAATGSAWRSAAVAALFAVHPLRVESVVWIAERKGVLSAFFWLLAMLAYLRYARRPGSGRYALVAAAMGFGLAAKAMVVTLPVALLLLDYWPLARWRPGDSGPPGRLRGMLLEKVPLLLLGLAATAAAFATQAATLQPLETLPAARRLALAAVSYATYLGDTVLPRGLAFLYPLPAAVPPGRTLAAALLLAALTALALARARRSPYLIVGWLWFLAVLVPVSGLAQFGAHARADRFTYLPSIGLTIAVVWGVSELLAHRPRLGRAAAVAAGAAVLALTVATRAQVATWRDSETLFAHAAAVTEDNYVAHLNLASLRGARGERERAMEHLRAALAAAPGSPDVLGGAADALIAWGRPREALPYLRRALAAAPDDPRLHHTAASAFDALGDAETALAHLRRAVALDPAFAAAQHGLGALLLRRGDEDGALAAFRAALAVDPSRLELYPAVIRLLEERGRGDEAAVYRAARARLAAGAPPATSEAPLRSP